MHQSSFRILRWTDDDRPFTKVCENVSWYLRSCFRSLQNSLSTRGSFPPRFTPRSCLVDASTTRFYHASRTPSFNTQRSKAIMEALSGCMQLNSTSKLMYEHLQDFQDLFCTLMVALPLGTHRYRLSKHRQTFTTGEALNHLGNLRFTQSNRRPSPNDPNVMVTTKIATTFSMVAPMARSLCNKFLAARLVESVEGKAEFSTTDSIWQLTSKGIKLLENFAHRNGVQERHVFEVLNSARNRMNLLVLERDSESDALSHDRATAEVIFRRFIGSDAPNTAGSVTSTSDTDVISDSNGQIGVRLTFERIFGLKSHKYTFSGSDAIRWLMECCTLVDVREAEEICSLFIDFQFIKIVAEDKPASRNKFPYTKGCYYKVSDSGIKVAHWNEDWVEPVPEKRERSPSGMKESNTNRMNMIVTTPSLRLMFRQYLKDTHCEENLVFFLEVKDFLGRWSHAVKRSRKDDTPALDTVRETLAAAYGKVI